MARTKSMVDIDTILIREFRELMGVVGYTTYDDSHKALFGDRLGCCYELAARALWTDNGHVSYSVPRPIGLAHGSWKGPETANTAIGHAWVFLEDGNVWEPVTRAVCDRDKFYSYTQARDKYLYDAPQVRRMLMKFQHWGPWQ